MMTVLHVAFGTIALIAAPAALFARKGSGWHRRFGQLFVGTMAIVLFTAGFLWQTRGHLFLVPLGGVSAYLIYSGYRAVARRRRRRPDEIEDRTDMLAAGAAIVAALGAAYLGLTASTPLLIGIAPALVGIGAIGLSFAINDIVGFAAQRMRVGWLLSHFSGMLAAYVSAVTAFLVINAHAVPMLVRWIVPSSIGALAIVAVTLRHVRLSLPGRRSTIVVEPLPPGNRGVAAGAMDKELVQ